MEVKNTGLSNFKAEFLVQMVYSKHTYNTC